MHPEDSGSSVLVADQAHADLTFTGNVPAEKSAEHDRLVHELVNSFSVVLEGQMEFLPPATIKPPSAIQCAADAFWRAWDCFNAALDSRTFDQFDRDFFSIMLPEEYSYMAEKYFNSPDD